MIVHLKVDCVNGQGVSSRTVLLGYCAKRPGPLPEHYDWGGPQEICSASGCIAGFPQTWFEDPFRPPSLNRAGCTSTAAEARERVAGAERSFRIFAYRALPIVFDKNGLKGVAAEALFQACSYLKQLPAEQDLLGFQRLGFDVVQYTDGLNWGCSPLTCNYMYQHHPINRYCLIDRIADAENAARAFASEEPEPGPYIIIEVFREEDAGCRLSDQRAEFVEGEEFHGHQDDSTEPSGNGADEDTD